MSNKPKRPVLSPTAEESMVYPFSEEEYRRGIATLKNNKAAGIDDVLVEQESWAQNSQVAACNAQQLLHSEQEPNNM